MPDTLPPLIVTLPLLLAVLAAVLGVWLERREATQVAGFLLLRFAFFAAFFVAPTLYVFQLFF